MKNETAEKRYEFYRPETGEVEILEGETSRQDWSEHYEKDADVEEEAGRLIITEI